MKNKFLASVVLSLIVVTCPAFGSSSPSALLIPQTAITIPGGAGKFDWMAIDSQGHRVLASHKGKGALEVVDMDSNKLVKSVETGACQGVAVGQGKYFIGDTDAHKVVILDAASLKQLGQVSVPGEIDALAYDDANQNVYADHDDGTDLWVVSIQKQKLIATIALAGTPEYIEYSAADNRLYQNIKDKNLVQVIDPDTNKIIAAWSTQPSTGPHGMAIDQKNGWLFTAGANGKLAVLDLKSGKLIASVDIAVHPDQIALDTATGRIYCACAGVIAIVQETKTGVQFLGNVLVHKGMHTLTVDSTTHSVWVCYSDANNSYIQRFNPVN